MNFLGLWKLWNKVFGFQYVTYIFGYEMSIGRVKLFGDLFYVHECCGGYLPIDKIQRELHPLTMSFEQMSEMVKHNIHTRDKYKDSK